MNSKSRVAAEASILGQMPIAAELRDRSADGVLAQHGEPRDIASRRVAEAFTVRTVRQEQKHELVRGLFESVALEDAIHNFDAHLEHLAGICKAQVDIPDLVRYVRRPAVAG